MASTEASSRETWTERIRGTYTQFFNPIPSMGDKRRSPSSFCCRRLFFEFTSFVTSAVVEWCSFKRQRLILFSALAMAVAHMTIGRAALRSG